MDAFQRQISQLRHQLGTNSGQPEYDGDEAYADDEYVIEPEYEPVLPPPRGRESSFQHRERSQDVRQYGGYSAEPTPDTESVTAATPNMPYLGNTAISVVAADTFWRGDLESSGAIHILGRAEGNITAKEDVFVAEEAEVDATINAENVVVAGVVRGTIRCAARLEVLPQGQVHGDTVAPTMVVHEGATLTGSLTMAGESSDIASGGNRPTAIVQRRARGGR